MLDKLNIPPQLRRKIDKELQPHEVIRWIGQPQPKVSSVILDSLSSFVLAIPVTAVAVMGIVMVIPRFKIPNLAKIQLGEEGLPILVNTLIVICFIMLFAAIGLILLLTPFRRWRAARETVYIITNKRAIAFEADKRAIAFRSTGTTTIRSFEPEQLSNVYHHEHTDGTCDVVITVQSRTDIDGDEYKDEIGFFTLSNCKEAETMLKELSQTAL